LVKPVKYSEYIEIRFLLTKENEAGWMNLPPDVSNGIGEGYSHVFLEISAQETGAMAA